MKQVPVIRLNIFHLFVILSLTQLYRYTPEIFLFSTATFKYTYRGALRRIGQVYSAKSSLENQPYYIAINAEQSVSITTKVVSSSPAHVDVYSIQHYVIKIH
jgi:hypothetical protein